MYMIEIVTMGKKINVAIAGVGNCASALVQGIHYYNSNSLSKDSVGLTSFNLGGYEPSDINFVAAFDIAESKVGKDLSEAILSPPNNALQIIDVPAAGIKVQKGNVLDGAGRHFSEVVKLSDKTNVDVYGVLKETHTDILINYLPVGSKEATRYYAEKCLEAGVCFINAIPVFISSDSVWQKRFVEKNVPGRPWKKLLSFHPRAH